MVGRWILVTFVGLILSIVMVAGPLTTDSRRGANGISCFVCSSHNTSDPNCEDPFHPAYSNYTKACEVPKQNHIGTFPAHFCVKIIGESASTSSTLVIRTCVLENMGSQCGVFKFGGKQLTGCILTCDSNGCNAADNVSPISLETLIFSVIAGYLVSLRAG